MPASRSGSAAPSPSCVRGTTRTRSSRRSRPRAASTSRASSQERTSSALARATYDGIGVDTGPILDRSDLFPREGKCQHAFCIDVDREGDVRVLANVGARPLLGGHDAPRARPRRLRHRLRPGAPLAPARHASHHDGGDRDPDGPTRAGGGLARAAWPGSAPTEAADLDGRLRAAQAAPSSSSSRAGCS